MKVRHALVISALVAVSLAQAQMSPDMKMPPPKSASASAGTTVMTEGVVQNVDVVKGVVTLKHGDIVNMQMPAMTMTFGVADKKLLSQVKAGDKVKFHVEMLKNAPTVTHLETVR